MTVREEILEIIHKIENLKYTHADLYDYDDLEDVNDRRDAIITDLEMLSSFFE